MSLSICTRVARRWRLGRLLRSTGILATALTLVATSWAQPSAIQLLPAEQAWVASHRGQTFTVAYDPFSGMDSFEFRGEVQGLLHAMIKDMQAQLGIRLEPAKVKGWDDAYRRFVQGNIDVLYGANPTPARERIMTFTRPALRYPYVVFARKTSTVQMLGDLDGKSVGFIANDFVSAQLPKEYPNIHYKGLDFEDQERGLKALVSGQISGFVTNGGGVEHEILFNFPDLAMVAELNTITSDMTFAVRKDNAMLGAILDKYHAQRKTEIAAIAQRVARIYNRKVLRLTDAELAWLAQKGTAVAGVAEDYLPFDYYEDGQYRGIAGETLRRISDLIGIRFTVFSGTFAQLYEKAKAGSIDVLNIAKTEDRLAHFIYPRPISRDRDIIVGLKTSPPVQDVYGLEGHTVAVITGFWHEEYLRKNLKDARIVKTVDILESLNLLRAGNVSYMIENPTVVEFYINGLGYTELVKRGETSKDSFVYFGVNRRQPELAAIMDKALTLVRFDQVKYAGIQSVPTLHNAQSRQLIQIVAALALVLVIILFVTVKIVLSLAGQKAQTRLLLEREKYLYTDPLTGFHNRNYFSHVAESLHADNTPQAIVVVDLNNLKHVNDAYGHAAGDAMLVLFAAAVRATLPDGNIFRIGGDEFVIILNNMTEAQVLVALDALRAECGKTGHAVHGNVTIHPSAATGYALRKSSADSFDECIASADARMYEAKASMKKRRDDPS